MHQRTAIFVLVLTTATVGVAAFANSSDSATDECGRAVVAASPTQAIRPADAPDAQDDPTTRYAISPVVPSAESSGYALHEWGLIRFDEAGPEVVTSGFDDRVQGIQQMPNERPGPAAPRKPVVYLHPDVHFDHATSIDLTVSLGSGVLHEVWPTPQLGAQPEHTNAFTWTGVQITEVPCGPQTAPSLTDLPCSSLGAGHVCEAAELSAYLRPVPHCMTWDGVAAPVLLYNGQIPSLDPPVHVAEDTVDGARRTQLSNIGGEPIGPVYVVEGRQVYRMDTLDVMSSWSTDGVVPSFWIGENDESLLASIQTDLRMQGLTENEANDFIDAWRPDVLNTVVLPWRVFGFYDETTIDRHLPLTATPAPNETVRVMAFTIEHVAVIDE